MLDPRIGTDEFDIGELETDELDALPVLDPPVDSVEFEDRVVAL